MQQINKKARNCLVVGGSGFIGSHLVDKLLERGHSVTVYGRKPARHASIETIFGDFTHEDRWNSLLEPFDAVFHLAWGSNPKLSNDDPIGDLKTGVNSTLRLLEGLRHNSRARVIFTSSGGVIYGTPKCTPIDEGHTTYPKCAYGISKMAVEHYLRLYGELHGLDYCILRVANPYGERQVARGGQGAIAAFVHRALNGMPIEVWGDGSVVRDYLHVDDVAVAISMLAEKELLTDAMRLMNVGSGRGQSINDILGEIQCHIKDPLDVRYLPGRPFDVPVNVLSINRIREELGWEPVIELNAGVSRLVEWMKSQMP
jgi:UDP-glucose 4-epimerase